MTHLLPFSADLIRAAKVDEKMPLEELPVKISQSHINGK